MNFLKLFILSAPMLAASASVIVVQSPPEQKGGYRDLQTCPIDAISCEGPAVDSCCSPTNGLLVMALQWDSRYGPSDAFTVHGLWPDTCKGKQLPGGGCDSFRSYTNVSSIIEHGPDAKLYEDMNTYWPSNKGDNNWFWTHEWVKHGTCVTTLQPHCYDPESYRPQQEVSEYFRKVLDLRAHYDIYKALNSSGIVPTEPESGRRPKNTYTLTQFKDAIRAAWGVEPNVKCRGRRMQEVWLWFKVMGRDRYYPVDPWGTDTCPKRISYQRKS
ncbi:hypothetical protein IW140_005269 [Coemansia sp. RSA 1813]|nr:hypothetical protein EV178_004262 [Coemansia sp. RSA 1646]KAJ1770835.1 hypothetical protein LPJ74_002821 [Coemansia sp. RSA 1843]KAJ2087114.1 hypothetical protein IW138_005212 [Coemansia sp. RSA 986]KAJ2211748.1 hypothetical protein EV179_005249 [Coemansia sp. RSA 487]KAJ2565633.1 hypothetical protein IW140_005269 [Coemansia sp. RSA 1813]